MFSLGFELVIGDFQGSELECYSDSQIRFALSLPTVLPLQYVVRAFHANAPILLERFGQSHAHVID